MGHGSARLVRREASGELRMSLRVKEGFSEEVAEKLSLEDENSARWKAGKVFQVVRMAEANAGREKVQSRFGTERGT